MNALTNPISTDLSNPGTPRVRRRAPAFVVEWSGPESIQIGGKGRPEEGWALFGCLSDEFCEYMIDLLSGALGVGNRPPANDEAARSAWIHRKRVALNAALQAVAAFEPADEMEAMLAVQAVAINHASMDCLTRALGQATFDGRALNLSQANKGFRTYATLVETLNRNRGKTTTQRVIVENVTVEAGGQAVVGAVAGGRGRQQTNGVQPHADTTRSASGAETGARNSALPGNHKERQALSASDCVGSDALPDARGRGRKRSADRQPERTEARPEHSRGHGRAPRAESAAARSEGDTSRNGALT